VIYTIPTLYTIHQQDKIMNIISTISKINFRFHIEVYSLYILTHLHISHNNPLKYKIRDIAINVYNLVGSQ